MIAKRLVCGLLLSASLVWAAAAQEPTPKPAQPPTLTPPRPATVTLMVEITVNRMRDGKRLSSVPYTLAVSPDGPRSTLRIGGEVPIPTTTYTPNAKEPNTNPFNSFSYRNVGTSIDVTGQVVPDGGYRLTVTLEESSVYPPDEAAKSGMTSPKAVGSGAPAFRSLRASNAFTIRDGQTGEFTAGSDLISGETARISVKLTVVK
jgi:Flp pilus assembly secretin CpaC